MARLGLGMFLGAVLGQDEQGPCTSGSSCLSSSGISWRTARGKQDEPGGQHPCPNAGFGAEWGRRRETLHQRPWPQPRREETPRQNLHQRPWPRPRREEPLRPRQPRREETPCKNLHQRPWPRPRREEPLRSRWCRPQPQREKALQPRSRRHHRHRFQAEAMAKVSHGIEWGDVGLLERTVRAIPGCNRDVSLA